MPNRSDRALFVFDDPIEAIRSAGGAMARVVEDGGTATLVTAAAVDAAGEAAIARLMGGDHIVTTPERVFDVVSARDITVVIVQPSSSPLVGAALNAAGTHGLPALTAMQGAGATVIDVTRQADGKRDAITALTGGTPDADTTVERFERLDEAAEASVSRGSRLGTAALAFVIGMVFGAVGTVAHQSTIEIAGVTIPWGIILAVGAVATLLVGLRLVVHDRLVVAAAALGLIGVIALFSLRSFGGSVLIPEGATGLVWTLAPAVIAALVLAWPNLPPRSAHPHRA